MNKADLIDAVATQTGATKTLSAEFVDAVVKAVSNSLAKAGTVQLIGFGSLSVVKTKARKGRNPRTGDTIKIPAGKRVKFVAGGKLKARVAKGK